MEGHYPKAVGTAFKEGSVGDDFFRSESERDRDKASRHFRSAFTRIRWKIYTLVKF
jgi:hypothetical protein